MKNKRIWIAAAGLVVAAAITWAFLRSAHGPAQAYRHATLERGNVESTISATGKLGAVTTVQVGTQVSGQVSAIYADFNDHVKKGQLIARIDPTLQQQAVREAEAGLEGNQAVLDKAVLDHGRAKQLHDGQLISDSDLNVSEYALAEAQASAKSGQVALDKARRNLAYTSIYAPIDGIVIERNVDVGQTVAASLSAPQIFLIANDLSQMQILASVDESDVGQIHEGMAVRFTVQSDAKEAFTGVVRQVRLQSATTENVVSYTVVIDVKNPDGKLLPGMTATVSFLTGSATDVFTVPNAALRIRPTPAMLAQTGSSRAVGASETAGSARTARARGATNATSDGLLWYLDAHGKLATTRVQVGISDGQKTEVRGVGLAAGMQVVIGTSASSSGTSSAASSPFQQQPASGPPGPRGGF
jgi:HlyD family secretion protein